MFPHFSLGELVVLLFVVLLIFGPKRLPELAGSLGRSVKHFKEGLRESTQEEAKPTAKKENSETPS